MELQLDATITVLLISKISSTCFGQIFAHLQERKNETFTTYGTLSCYVVGRVSGRVAWHYVYVCDTDVHVVPSNTHICVYRLM
jgi:hypothetical protein